MRPSFRVFRQWQLPPRMQRHKVVVLRVAHNYLTLWRSPQDARMLLVSVVYFVVCSYITCLANSYVDRVNPNNLLPEPQRRPLLDPGMEAMYKAFAASHLPANVADTMVRLAAAVIFGRCLSLGSRSATVTRRVFYIAGTVYLLRAPTVVMTVLPNPYVQCETHFPLPPIPIDALSLFIQERMSCGDVFFSGHSIFFVISARVWITYTRWLALRIAAALFGILGLLSLLFSSYHYSIDVFMATLIITTLYSVYHWIIYIDYFGTTWYGKLLRRLDYEEELDRQAAERQAGVQVVDGSTEAETHVVPNTENVGDGDIQVVVHRTTTTTTTTRTSTAAASAAVAPAVATDIPLPPSPHSRTHSVSDPFHHDGQSVRPAQPASPAAPPVVIPTLPPPSSSAVPIQQQQAPQLQRSQSLSHKTVTTPADTASLSRSHTTRHDASPPTSPSGSQRFSSRAIPEMLQVRRPSLAVASPSAPAIVPVVTEPSSAAAPSSTPPQQADLATLSLHDFQDEQRS
ncbi:hypothetical protein RI367_005142 [Sorochytrium milnesiophthora]